MTPKLRSLPAAAIIGLLLVGATTRTANAYLDPGTGSMILQVLLGGIAGAAVVLKLYWHKLKALFGVRGEKDTASGNDRTS